MMALALLALPAQAEECFSGLPRQVQYDNGQTYTIIQHHGDDLTYTTPYEGYQDSVTKTHLMLFPKQSRMGARATEFRWSSRLPGMGALTPGYSFDLSAEMKSGDGKPLPYNAKGQVLGIEPVEVGKCSYDALVVQIDTFVGETLVTSATDYLSADMMVLLKVEMTMASTGQVIKYAAIGLQ
jgi:hypothetical protein